MAKQLVDRSSNETVQAFENGKKQVVKIVKGQHLRLEELAGLDLEGVVASKEGSDLYVRYADGTEVVVEGYFEECVGDACSLTLPGEGVDGFTVSADASGMAEGTAEGEHVIYTSGPQTSSMELASTVSTASATSDADTGESALTGTEQSDAAGGGLGGLFTQDSSTLWGVVGGVAALGLAAGGGGGGGSSAAANIVSGVLAAGPVMSTNGLTVEIYKADGTTKLGESTVSGNGSFSVNVGSYNGVVIARVVDANDGNDYYDEATGSPVDLSATLMAVGVVDGATLTLNINPLTTVAAVKAGVDAISGLPGAALESSAVDSANTAVAGAFGLTDLLAGDVVLALDANGDPATPNAYGAVLAALSGMDQNLGGTQTTITTLAAELDAVSGTLSSDGVEQVMDGATTASVEEELVAVLTAAPAWVSVDAVASDGVINAQEATIGITVTGTKGADDTVTLNGNLVSATGDTSWSYLLTAEAIAAFGEGAETLTVVSTDGSGSTTLTRTVDILVDTLAPTAVAFDTVAADDVINAAESAAGVTVSGTKGTGDTVTLNGNTVTADSDTTWSYVLSADEIAAFGEDGETLIAVASDAAGNTTTTTHNISIDTVVPEAPQIVAVASDDVINANESAGGVTVIGTKAAGDTVTLNGNAVTVDSDTTWSYTLSPEAIAAFGEGAETLTVVTTDAAGNSTTTARDISVDTQVSATISVVAMDDVINAAESAAGVTVTGTKGVGDTVTLNGNAVTADSDTTWSYTLTTGEIAAFGEGAETLSLVVTDAAGNSATVTRDISVDTAPPPAAAVDTVATDDVINAAESGAGVIVTGTNAAGTTVTLNGNAVTADSATTWSYTLTPEAIAEFSEGTVSLTLEATDAAGNTTGSTHDVLLDTVAPTAAGVDAVASDEVINAQEAAAGVTVTGTKAAGDTVTLNGVETSADSDTTWSYTLSADAITAFGEGAESLALVTTDASGNSTNSTHAISVDTTAPTAAGVDAVANDEVINATEAAAGVTVTGTKAAGDTVTLNGVQTSEDSDTTWSYTLSADAITAFGEGAESLALVTTDAAGNSTESTHAISVDTAAPSTSLSDASYSALTGVLVVNGTNFDSLGVDIGTDVKEQLDWSKFVWDINGDNLSTADTSFALGDVASAVVTSAETLAITLTSEAKTALEATAGYGNTGGNDTLDVGAGFIVDTSGNAGTTSLTNGALSLDDTAPTTTLTSAAYNSSTGVLTLSGSGLETIGVANGTDVKQILDWSKFVWDINRDDATTPDYNFALADITSAVVTNASTLTVTLTTEAKAALEATSDFAAAGGVDGIDVSAGFVRDEAGNAASTDGLADGSISYSDTTRPTVQSFSSSTDNGVYKAGDSINITATMSETVQAGSTFNVTLGTSDTVTLTADATGAILSGTYVIGAGDTSSDLTINSFTAGSVTDVYGNTMTSTTLPTSQNLSDNAAIVVDTTAPTTTLTSGSYNGSTGVLTLTGTNLNTLGVANGSDVKAQLNWAQLVWDINGDDTTTANATFALADIASAVVTNSTSLAITLTAEAKAVLEATAGFGATGGADKLDVGAGFISDTAGNPATTDGLNNGTITYSDSAAPTVLSFSSTTADGAYKAGDSINITATMSETVLAGSTFNVTLGTSDTVTLTAAANGTTLSGSYVIGAGDSSSDLTISSFTAGTVTDLYGNVMTSTTLPVGENLSNNAAIVVDTTAPTTTLSSAAYNDATGVLTVTGANLNTLGVANGTDVKAQLDWSQFVWDINGDGSTTTDVTFVETDIQSAVVTNSTTLTITLTAAAQSALESTAGFAATGGSDKLDVSAGFISDLAGNTATTDGLANGAISYSDVTPPSAPTSAPTAVAGPYINADESAAGFSVVVSLAGTNAVVGDRVELKIGGQSFSTPLVRTLTSDDVNAGSYSFTVPAEGLGSDGNKSLTAVVTDVFGNVGAASPALALTLDTSAPTDASLAPTVTVGATVDSAEAAAGFSVVATLSGTGAKTGDIVELQLNGASFADPLTHTLTASDITAGSYTFTVDGGDLGSDGTKVLTSVITDAAGNVGSASPELSLTLNTTGVRSIEYSATQFNEAADNDGSIHSAVTLTLSGGTFAGTVGEVISAVSFSNVPTGLTARLVKASDTTATLELSGQAGAHADANDIANLTVTLQNGAFSGGNASTVEGAIRTDLVINFADGGRITSGNAGDNFLLGSTADDIIYGNGGADVVIAGQGSDTIVITDATATESGSATIVMSSEAYGLDYVIGFKGGAVSAGGDVLDLAAIASLVDSVATGLTVASDFGDDNVFVFNSTEVSIEEAAAAIAADADVTATEGYIVISDNSRDGDVTIYHSSDLGQNGTETALLILEGLSIGSLSAANFVV